jgi:hypothetical protein
MRFPAVLGVILIVIGAIALILQGITVVTGQEVLDLGPLSVRRQERRTIPLPPILGVVLVAAGVVLVVAGSSRRA